MGGAPNRSEAVLSAITFAAKAFARAQSWEEAAPDVLARLGRAIDVSRASVFENFKDSPAETAATFSRRRFEWAASSVAPLIEDPRHREYSRDGSFAPWAAALGAGELIHGPVDRVCGRKRLALISEEALSVAVAPIFAGEDWWGFIAYEDCEAERKWTRAEIEGLRAAAETLGAAIERCRVVDELRAAETQLRMHVEAIPAITYIEFSDETQPLGFGESYLSPQIEAVLGYTPEEWVSDFELWKRVMHPDDLDRVVEESERTSRTGEPFRMDYRMRARDGHIVWIRDESHLVRDEDGTPRYWHGVMVNITEQKEAEEALKEAEAKNRALIERIPAITYLDPIDENEPSMYVSSQVERILGCTVEAWLNTPDYWSKHLHPDDTERVWETYVHHRETGEPLSHEYRMVREDGRVVWIREEASVVRDSEGNPLLVQGLMYDVTARKEAEEQVSFLAYHDSLTRLANRAMFEEMLEPAMARARRANLAVAILYLDLDDFKAVNDTLGHDAGDELLKQVARRLDEATRDTDLVARQGGDEFLVLLPDIEFGPESEGTEGDPIRVAEMMAGRIHDVMRAPFVLGREEITSSASIGISVFPIDAADGRALLKNADVAMYESKKGRPGSSVTHARAS